MVSDSRPRAPCCPLRMGAPEGACPPLLCHLARGVVTSAGAGCWLSGRLQAYEPALLEVVQRFGIMVQDPLFGFLADRFELLERHNGVRIAGGVQMPIVRPNDEAPLPGVLEDPGQV